MKTILKERQFMILVGLGKLIIPMLKPNTKSLFINSKRTKTPSECFFVCHFLLFFHIKKNLYALITYTSLRYRLVRGTGQDATGRDVSSHAWCAKNGWNPLFHETSFSWIFRSTSPPWNDSFHPRGTKSYNILRQQCP